MALYKDGKVYRTLEQQVGYLSEKQNEQETINEEVQEDINTIEEEISELPTKQYVDDADALKTNKGEEIIVLEISSTSGTLSDENFALLEKENIIVKYNHYYMTKMLDSTTYYRFAGIHNQSKYYLFEVTKSTKAYTITDTPFNVQEDGVVVISSGGIVGKVLTVNSSYQSEWKNVEVHDSNIISDNVAAGHVLTSNGSNGASWQSIPAQTPEGTSIKSTGVTSGKVLTADGSGGASWQDDSGLTEVTAGDVDSETATLGQVLTADGSGGASWQDAGGGVEIVDLGTVSSINATTHTLTLTSAQVTKLENDNVIVKISTGNYTFWLRKQYKSNTIGFEYFCIDVRATNRYIQLWKNNSTSVNYQTNNYINSTGATSGQALVANGSGGSSWLNIRGSDITAIGVTSGKVLTANGSDGASWQTPTTGSIVTGTNDGTNWTSLTIDGTTKNIPSGGGGGGGTQLYMHTLTFNGLNYCDCIVVFSKNSTPYNSLPDFLTDTNNVISYYVCLYDDEGQAGYVPIIALSTKGAAQIFGIIHFYSVNQNTIGTLVSDNLYNATNLVDTVTTL